MFDRTMLTELRDARYVPRAWWPYVRGHLRLARQRIETRPVVVRSILSTGFTLLAMIFLGAAAVTLWVDAGLGRRLFLWCALWLTIHLGWVLAHLGLLADRQSEPMLRLGLPNTITLIRSLTVPGMILCMQDGRLHMGLLLYAAGAVADVADGALARRRNQVTRLGTALDPLVDMAWNTAAAYGLVVAAGVPIWILLLLGVRYFLLLLGSALLYFAHTSLLIRPTLFGKASGAAISTAFVLAFLNRLLLPPVVAERLAGLIHVAMGFFVGATVAYVFVLGALNYRARDAMPAKSGQVVGHVDARRSTGTDPGDA